MFEKIQAPSRIITALLYLYFLRGVRNRRTVDMLLDDGQSQMQVGGEDGGSRCGIMPD